MGGLAPSFLTLALDERKKSATRLGHSNSRKRAPDPPDLRLDESGVIADTVQ
jgi:hypothetical protein